MGHATFKQGRVRVVFGIFFFIICIYVTWIFIWAQKENSVKRVQIGRTVCAKCGMIISDLRFSTSIWRKDQGGLIELHHFDDVGCFIQYLKLNQGIKWNGWGHDLDTQEEIPLAHLFFTHLNLQTPMASGWIATKDHLRYPSAKELSAILNDP